MATMIRIHDELSQSLVLLNVERIESIEIRDYYNPVGDTATDQKSNKLIITMAGHLVHEYKHYGRFIVEGDPDIKEFMELFQHISGTRIVPSPL